MWSVILLILLFWFVLPPLLKAIGNYVTRHAARKINDSFMRAAGVDPDEMRRRQRRREAEERAASRGGWSQPAPVVKKIDSSVATDVKFQEIKSETSAPHITDEAPRPTAAEPQIEDVTWEDLPR